MRAQLCLVALLALGCAEKPPPGPEAWKQAFSAGAFTAEWGYVHTDGYHRLSEPQKLGGAELRTLRAKVLSSSPGPFKCIIHIDARLTAGDVTANVCTSCGLFVVAGKQWNAGSPNGELMELLEGVLGPRPAEPFDPALEGL